jgi:hypothetical protein
VPAENFQLMEEEKTEEFISKEDIESNGIQIYSRLNIIAFSILFSSIFGAALVVSNLRAVGNRQAAKMVSIFAILYFVATLVIVMIPSRPMALLTLAINYIGGKILADHFQKTLIPGSLDYPKKSILKPLIISLLICAVIIIFSWNSILGR